MVYERLCSFRNVIGISLFKFFSISLICLKLYPIKIMGFSYWEVHALLAITFTSPPPKNFSSGFHKWYQIYDQFGILKKLQKPLFHKQKLVKHFIWKNGILTGQFDIWNWHFGFFFSRSKFHIFWEGHKILRNLHLTFVHSTYRIYEV